MGETAQNCVFWLFVSYVLDLVLVLLALWQSELTVLADLNRHQCCVSIHMLPLVHFHARTMCSA